jgi:hypothetical protein
MTTSFIGSIMTQLSSMIGGAGWNFASDPTTSLDS